MFLILIKWSFQNFHHWPAWAGGMCKRIDFKGSRSSLAVIAFANSTLYVNHLVLHSVCWDSALLWASRASSDCRCLAAEPRRCWCSCGRAAPLKEGWHSSALGPWFWQLREGPVFLVHSSILLHREYQAQVFPWPSRATVVLRSHWTVNVWSSLLCSEHSRKEISSFNQLLFSLCFSSGEVVFPVCRFLMYFSHPKEHSYFFALSVCT